jgi:hypothetical protein
MIGSRMRQTIEVDGYQVPLLAQGNLRGQYQDR